MGEEVDGAELHPRAAPALPREGAPEPRRVRADAGAEQLRVRAADDRPGDRAQPRRRRLPAARSPTPRCSTAIADPDYQTELARYNIELNVPPRPLPGDSALELEDELRGRLNAGRRRGQRTRRPHRRDRHPADAHARALRGRVDQRQQPLHRPQRLDLRRPRRGHLPRHRGADGGAGGDLLRLDRPRVRLHQRPAAPAGGAPGLRRPLERRAGAGRARSSRWPPTRRSSSASGCTPRPASSCSSRPPTPAASS